MICHYTMSECPTPLADCRGCTGYTSFSAISLEDLKASGHVPELKPPYEIMSQERFTRLKKTGSPYTLKEQAVFAEALSTEERDRLINGKWNLPWWQWIGIGLSRFWNFFVGPGAEGKVK